MTTHPSSQYNSASASFSEWLRYPKIAKEVKRIRDQIMMPVEEALARTSMIGRADIGDFLKPGPDGFMYFDLSHPEAINNMHLIAQIETKRERRVEGYGEQAQEFEGEWVKVKLHDKQGALRDLLKIHKQFVQKVEVTGKDGAPLNPPIDANGYAQSFDALVNALGEALSGVNPDKTGTVDTTQ